MDKNKNKIPSSQKEEVRNMAKKLKKVFNPKFAAWFGIFAPICAIIFIGVSIALTPWFDWTNNALSDLGVSDVAFIFNSGLKLIGVLTALFAIALMRVERKSLSGLFGSIGLFVVGLGAFGAGVYTEATFKIHMLFSITCFIALIASAILFSIRFALDSRIPRVRKIVFVIGSIGSLTFIGFILASSIRLGLATLEVLLALPIIPWYILLSVRLYTNENEL